MIIYGLKNCSTCRAAAKALGAQISDLRDAPIDPALLQTAYAQFGDKLLNTRSTTWRGLSEAQRTSPPLALMAEFPALIKRPLIAKDDGLYLGWGADTQNALMR